MDEYKITFIAVTVILTIILITIEILFPARTYEKPAKQNSYLTNLLLFGFNNTITILLQVSAVFAIVLTYSPTAGFFTLIPIWMQVILGILILDFSIWVWHVLNHRIPLLWSFHKCHHSEQYLNATSALRFHIGELLLSILWKSAILIAFGIPLWLFALSEFLLTIFALFHHSNIKLSPKTRKIVELFFISPYLHRVHHSDIRIEHDSNYGVIFSWWDKIFNTAKHLVPARIGLEKTKEKTFFSFLTFPFKNK
jgi:sterol desaturase/sphingolipid hydroxylase (fatty acid hydroxylase superfamily)